MCDSIVAVGGETAAGLTLFGKNSDREPGECQPFEQWPAAHHAPGTLLRCTHVEIPQVAETYRVMGHSPWWVFGFEHGVNEHAVAIGNQTVFSNEPIEERPGLIGMDLVRLGLERGRSAREALEVIAGLIERHGQGGAARGPDASGYHNGFLLADPTEAWQLETSNRRWAARRVTLASCSNHMSIADDWDIASRDLEPFARSNGWWTQRGRIDVAAAYRNPHVPPHVSEGRWRRAGALLRATRGSHDLASFTSVLRDHGDGGGVWTGGDAAPSEERFFTLCAHSAPVHETTASLVAPLPAQRPGPWAVWIAFGTPCTGVFLPVYLDGVIPAQLARRDAEGGAAWHLFAALQDAAARDPQRHTPALRDAWKPFEARVEQERTEVERAARAAAVASDADHAAALVSDFMERTVADALDLAETLRDALD